MDNIGRSGFSDSFSERNEEWPYVIRIPAIKVVALDVRRGKTAVEVMSLYDLADGFEVNKKKAADLCGVRSSTLTNWQKRGWLQHSDNWPGTYRVKALKTALRRRNLAAWKRGRQLAGLRKKANEAGESTAPEE